MELLDQEVSQEDIEAEDACVGQEIKENKSLFGNLLNNLMSGGGRNRRSKIMEKWMPMIQPYKKECCAGKTLKRCAKNVLTMGTYSLTRNSLRMTKVSTFRKIRPSLLSGSVHRRFVTTPVFFKMVLQDLTLTKVNLATVGF